MVSDAAPTDEFVEGLPFFGIRQLPALRAIGTVVGEKVRRSPNPHVPGTETEFRTLEFGGLVLDGFVKTGEGGGFATCHAVVSGGTWLLPKGLRVGVEFAAVERALGPPVITEGDVRRYGGFRTQTQVDFKVEAGRVTEVVVEPWCD